MGKQANSTTRSIATSSGRSLKAVGNSLVSRGLHDLTSVKATQFSISTALSSDIHVAVRNGENLRVKEILKEAPQKINAKDKDGNEPLHWAASENSTDLVALLLSFNAQVNVQNRFGATPLLYSIRRHKDTAELLLAHGANVNIEDIDQYTPLIAAVTNGNTKLVELLLSYNADANSKVEDCFSVLHIAAQHDYSSIVELLLAQGADINAEDHYEKTPLDYAGETVTSEILREYGGTSGGHIE